MSPGQNGHPFANGIVKHIFMNENFCILIKNFMEVIPKGIIDNNTALVQVMAWH